MELDGLRYGAVQLIAFSDGKSFSVLVREPWLAGGLAGWLAWLTGLLAASWLPGCLSGLLVAGWLADWPASWLVCLFVCLCVFSHPFLCLKTFALRVSGSEKLLPSVRWAQHTLISLLFVRKTPI